MTKGWRVFKVCAGRTRCKRDEKRECKGFIRSVPVNQREKENKRAGFISNLDSTLLFCCYFKSQLKKKNWKQIRSCVKPSEGQQNRKGWHNSSIGSCSGVKEPHNQLHGPVRKDLLQAGVGPHLNPPPPFPTADDVIIPLIKSITKTK